MKNYCGERMIDGLVVTVDGIPLDEKFDIEIFDERGFEWSYEGSAPRQLALAILVDYYDNIEKAKSAVEVFMTSVIANLDNVWTLSGDEIDKSLS